MRSGIEPNGHEVAGTCGRCGQVHAWCSAHTHRGTPCGQHPQRGQRVCHIHGGRSPQAQAKAARRIEHEQASTILRRFGVPVDTTPAEALLETVKWTAGYVAWLRDKVAATESDEQLVFGLTRRTSTSDGSVTNVVEARVNVWVQLLGEYTDRLTRVCSEAIRAGIEARRVTLAERQGQLVADVIRSILGDLELSAEQQARVGEVVPLRLRALNP